MTIKPIFNLEFPPHVYELRIGSYVFTRSTEYKQAFCQLQHLVSGSGSEFKQNIQGGCHQVTALVELPDQEESAVLEWADQNPKKILDVLLLLSIFTGRNVFIDMDEDGGVAIMQDHRKSSTFGGTILLSLPKIPMCREKSSGIVQTRSAMDGKNVKNFEQFDAGFETGLNAVLNLISSSEWRNKYQNGYFLFLFRQALRLQIIETSLILCWTIWEHLFTLHNQSWMDSGNIYKLSGKEKITFIYNEYFGMPTKEVFSEIEKLAKTRNRIVHFGRNTSEEDMDAMERFIRMTEKLVATILGLKPSDTLDGAENLRKLLNP